MPKPLTVLFVLSESELNRHAQAAIRQARILKLRGHRVLLSCMAGSPAEARAKKYNLQTFTDIKFPGAFPRKDLWRECRIMARRIDIEMVDAVHAHGATESWIASVGTRLATRCPAVIRTVDSEVKLVTGLFGRLVHQGLTDHLVIASGSAYETLRLAPDFDPNMATLIYNGVDLKRFKPSVDGHAVRKEFDVSDDVPLVVMTGPNVPGRGHEVFFEALVTLKAQLPNVRGLCACKDASKDELQELAAQAKKLGADQALISFTGTRTDLQAVLAASDVVVVPDTKPVHSHRVTLQAMAVGRAVVGSAVPGIADFIQGGITGELVAPGDAKELAAALLKICSDRKESQKRGLSGRLAAEQQFSEDLSAERLEDLYLRVIEDHGGAEGGFEG